MDNQLREKIYNLLGLEFGSLPQERGNDWERAKNQILEEEKQLLFESMDKQEKIDYTLIDKNNKLFGITLNSSSVFEQTNKVGLAKREDLEDKEIDILIDNGDKDVLINLTEYQNLNNNQIDIRIVKSVYKSLKNIVEYQNLNDTHFEMIEEKMGDKKIYKDLKEELEKMKQVSKIDHNKELDEISSMLSNRKKDLENNSPKYPSKYIKKTSKLPDFK